MDNGVSLISLRLCRLQRTWQELADEILKKPPRGTVLSLKRSDCYRRLEGYAVCHRASLRPLRGGSGTSEQAERAEAKDLESPGPGVLATCPKVRSDLSPPPSQSVSAEPCCKLSVSQ